MQLPAVLSIILAVAVAAPASDGTRYVVPRSAVKDDPFRFPLPNGFPDVTNPSTFKSIAQQAGGPFPSGSGKSALSATSSLALQGLAFNELMEAAFFTELLQNITQSVPGYELGDDREQVIAALTSSQAQEELHLLSANMGLKNSGFDEIKPCAYVFPVTSFAEAIRMADAFSGLLMGALGAVINQFQEGGDASASTITQFCSVLGQEGQQDGFFRLLASKVPNESPFLVSTTLSFLFNHIKQSYVAPNSCPSTINLPHYEILIPLEQPGPANTTVRYNTTQMGVTTSDYVAYMSGQITPVVVPISDITKHGSITTFTAEFPYDANFSRGLTVAALVNNKGPFANASQVADSTLAGPGLFQVN